jgi:hypothetical protein
MQPNGAKKNKLAQAIFSKDGPYLTRPAVTSSPRVTPKIYNTIKSNIRGIPISKIDTPNNGIAISEAGIRPIKVRKIAVNVKAVIISLNFIGAINRLVKFLLQISSRNIML